MKNIQSQIDNFQVFYKLYGIFFIIYLIVFIFDINLVLKIDVNGDILSDNQEYFYNLLKFIQFKYHIYFIYILLCLSFVNFVFRSQVLLKILIVAMFYSVHCSYPTLSDGGTVLIIIILFLSIFIKTRALFEFRHTLFSDFELGLSAAAIKIIKFQILFMYISAFFLKINSDLWLSGVGNYYIMSQYDTSFSNLIISNDKLIFLSTYFVMIIQVLYPISVLMRGRYKKLYIVMFIAIICFHVSTWVSLGLFSFALSAIFANFIFINFNKGKLVC